MSKIFSMFSKEQVSSLVRTVLKTAGSFFGAEAYFTGDEFTMVVGGIAVLAGVIWSALAHNPNNPVV